MAGTCVRVCLCVFVCHTAVTARGGGRGTPWRVSPQPSPTPRGPDSQDPGSTPREHSQVGRPRLLSSGCCLEQLCSEPDLGVYGGELSLVPPLVGGAVGFTPRSCPGVPSELVGRVGAAGRRWGRGSGGEDGDEGHGVVRLKQGQGQDRSGTSDR